MPLSVCDALARLLARPIAHRGLHEAGAAGPVENSLGAARAAVASGYGIECDVRLSRDGEVVVFHDADLERLTGAAGRVCERDAAALATLRLRGTDDGIPTLRQLLETIGGRVPLVVEIKTSGDDAAQLTERTLAALEGYPEAIAIESFDAVVVHRCRDRHVDRPVGLVGPPEDGGAREPGTLAACDFLSWSIDHLTEVVATGLPLSTWTVRSPAQAALAARCRAQIVFEGFRPATVR